MVQLKNQDNELWLAERFTMGQAWVDLLLLANHADGSFWVRRIEVHVKRGEVAYSALTLAARWKWNRKTVARFLGMLKKRGMVDTRISNLTTVITPARNILTHCLLRHTEQRDGRSN